MSDENIELTALLHRRADELPVFVRGASGLRRAAERTQRRRRVAVTAVSVTAAVLLGVAALSGGIGRDSVSPPPAETPTSPPGSAERGLLTAEELPTGVPFGAWTGYADQTDPSDGPLCVDEFSAAGAAQWLIRAFKTDTAGVDGYQAVVRFTSVDGAKHAGSVMTDLAICGPRSKSNFEFGLDGRGGGSAQNGRGITPGDPVISLVWSRSQQYVSVLWLSWRSAVLVTDPVQDRLRKVVGTRLADATEDFAPVDPTSAELAMLGPSDVPSAGTERDTDAPVTNGYADPYTYWPLHSCDVAVADGAPLREVILGGNRLGVLAGERLILATSEPSAQNQLSELRNRIERCDAQADPAVNGGIEITNAESMSLPDVGENASGWQYDRRWPGGERDHVYVAIFRNGPLIAQVVRIVRDSDPAPAAVAELVTVAADRLAAQADELARTGLRPH